MLVTHICWGFRGDCASRREVVCPGIIYTREQFMSGFRGVAQEPLWIIRHDSLHYQQVVALVTGTAEQPH